MYVEEPQLHSRSDGATFSSAHANEHVKIDSAFQLTEHLKALHYSYTHPADGNTIQPVTAEIAKQLTTPPPNTSKDIWLYELGRFLIQKTNAIIVALFQDDPPCSPHTCPEMRASEWQYLCAVHDPPKSCAAIDYCCHTLDWAATTLTSSKMFPSRLGLGSGPSGAGMAAMGGDKVLLQQMKEIKNIFRRVYRIYAHAWFQHREMFWRVEGKTGLYVFFKMVCDAYGIIEPENYTIPAEAEGLEPAEPEEQDESKEVLQAPPQVLRRDQDASPTSPKKAEDGFGLGDTTKRHRHTKSDFARDPSAVIKEEVEEEEEQQHEQEAETPSSSFEKPTLGRQDTALRSTPELDTDFKPEEEAEGEADLETPISKQPQEVTESATVTSDDIQVEVKPVTPDSVEEEGEQTIVEVAEEVKSEDEATENVVSELTASDEVSQDQEPAAKSDDATKSVGD